MVVYDELPSLFFGRGVEITEEAGDFLDAPPRDVGGTLHDPWIFDLYDSSETDELDLWTEPTLSEVLAILPTIPNPEFRIDWAFGAVSVTGPITSITVPEPAMELLGAWAMLACEGLAARSARRRVGAR